MSQPHVLLLRGVNVGGHNRVPMRDLVEIVEHAGGLDARTYIQSGNVVCRCDDVDLPRLCGEVQAALRTRLGVESPVIGRSGAELRAMIERNPFSGPEANVHVAFLLGQPVGALDPSRSPGDTALLLGREVWLHLPQGVARTRLTNTYMDRALGTISTVRNWRTVQVLGQWTDAATTTPTP